jgi:hypothetical protein
MVMTISENEKLRTCDFGGIPQISSLSVIEKAVSTGRNLVEVAGYGIFRREDLFRLRNMHRVREFGEECINAKSWIHGDALNVIFQNLK